METEEANQGVPAAVEEIKGFLEIEDAFNCSGMCREALFYFGRDMNEVGPPKETCLHHVKKHMMENGVPYTVMTVLLAMNAFWIWMLTFCMFRKGEDINKGAHREDDRHDFDDVGGQNYPATNLDHYGGSGGGYNYGSGGGGVQLGGSENQGGDFKSASQLRAEAHEKKREEAKYRGVSKESRIEM